jgi:hypothetical protein
LRGLWSAAEIVISRLFPSIDMAIVSPPVNPLVVNENEDILAGTPTIC